MVLGCAGQGVAGGRACRGQALLHIVPLPHLPNADGHKNSSDEGQTCAWPVAAPKITDAICPSSVPQMQLGVFTSFRPFSSSRNKRQGTELAQPQWMGGEDGNHNCMVYWQGASERYEIFTSIREGGDCKCRRLRLPWS